MVPTSRPSPEPSPSPIPTAEIGGPCHVGFIFWTFTRPTEEQPGRHLVPVWATCPDVLGREHIDDVPPEWWPGPVPRAEVEAFLGRTIEEHVDLVFEGWEPSEYPLP